MALVNVPAPLIAALHMRESSGKFNTYLHQGDPLGKPAVKVLSDGWTAVTRDKSLSSQCEHSIGVTEDGLEIFTASPKGLFRPKF